MNTDTNTAEVSEFQNAFIPVEVSSLDEAIKASIDGTQLSARAYGVISTTVCHALDVGACLPSTYKSTEDFAEDAAQAVASIVTRFHAHADVRWPANMDGKRDKEASKDYSNAFSNLNKSISAWLEKDKANTFKLTYQPAKRTMKVKVVEPDALLDAFNDAVKEFKKNPLDPALSSAVQATMCAYQRHVAATAREKAYAAVDKLEALIGTI